MYRILIKVLFIEVLIEQVKEQRKLYVSLEHLNENVSEVKAPEEKRS